MGALYTARRKTIETRDVIVASLAFGIAMCVMAGAPGLGLAFPLGIAVGWTSIAFMTASTAIVQVRADPAMRGRVLALQAIVFLGSTPIGGPLLGLICDAYGARAGLLVGGVAAIGAAVFGMLVVRHRTRRIARVDEAVPSIDGPQASYAR
jgi:MFS family permease